MLPNFSHPFLASNITGHIRAHDTETAATVHAFCTSNFGSVPRQGNCCDHWFTGLTGCELSDSSLLASCNLGYVALFDSSCKLAGRWKLHKGKVSSVEFNPVDFNTFVTTSVDRTCCIWDIRFLRISHSAESENGNCEPLLSQSFDGAVTSAYFSRNGQRLLVTSQNNSVRVCQVSVSSQGASLVRSYQPGWGKECLQVSHPHRFYQHITPIKVLFP